MAACERCGREQPKSSGVREKADARAERRVKCARCQRLVCKTCGFENRVGGAVTGRCWEACAPPLHHDKGNSR